MLRLLIFELQRKWKPALATVAAYLVLNYVLFLKLNDVISKSTNLLETATSGDLPEIAMFVFFLGFGVVVLALIDAVNNMRLELKKSTRDLYFSIPIGSFQVLGAKLIVSVIGIIASSVLSVLTIFYTVEKLVNYNFLEQIFSGIRTNLVNFSYMATEITLSISVIILLIYVTFAIYRSFFSQFKFGGIITIVIYALINYLYFRYLGQYIELDLETYGELGNLWVEGVWPFVALVVSNTVLFGFTGYLLERRVNFD